MSLGPSLLDLPEDVLLRVLAGAGCKGISAAAASSTRLCNFLPELTKHTVFASATSTNEDLQSAVHDAADRALQGMLGAVDFALMFVANYAMGSSSSTSAAAARQRAAVKHLRACLPMGVPIVGSVCNGLMGVGADGKAMDVDPSDTCSCAVTVLLGRMPGCHVSVFAARQADLKSPRGRLAMDGVPYPNIAKWLGLNGSGGGGSGRERKLQSAWLFTRWTGQRALVPPGSLLEWLQSPELGSAVVTGGIASGTGDLFFDAGNLAANAPEGWPAEVESVQLLAVGLVVSVDAGPRTGTGGAPALQPSGRAAAFSTYGVGKAPGSEVFRHVEALRDQAHEGDGDDALLYVLGGVSSSGKGIRDLMDELLQMGRAGVSPHLAFWDATASPGSEKWGFDPEVFASGRALVAEISGYGADGLVASVPSQDTGPLMAILAAGRSALCCQLCTINAEACRENLSRQLGCLRDLVAPPLPTSLEGRPCPPSWEGYDIVQKAAKAVGARSGQLAALIISCTGRGRAAYGDAHLACEACTTDEALQGSVPFAGIYCDGEVGPEVRRGFGGWAVCTSAPAADPADPEAFMMADSAQGIVPARGRRALVGGWEVQLQPCTLQGYTSIYAALG